MVVLERLRLEIDASQAKAGATAFKTAVEATIKSTRGLNLSTRALNRRLDKFAISAQAAAKGMAGFTTAVGAGAVATQGRLATATDKGTGAINRQTQVLTTFGGRIKSVALGLAAFTSLTAGIGAVGSGVRSIVDFEQAIIAVGQVTKRAGENTVIARVQFEELTGTIRQLGATTRFTATEIADGALNLARAGFSVTEISQSLAGVGDLAQAGFLSLAQAADIASTTVRQFGLAASKTRDIADTLVTVSNRTNTTIEQLAAALKFAGPVANALGLELGTTAAALGVLADSGIRASLAGTNLRSIFATLLDLTPKASEELASMGLTLADIDPRVVSLTEALANLRVAQFSASNAARIFRRRNVAAILSLVAGADKLATVEDATNKATDASNKFARALEESVGVKARTTASAFEELALALGDLGGSDLFKSILDSTTELLRLINQTATGTGKLTVVLSGLIGFGVARGILGLTQTIFKFATGIKGAAVATTALNVAWKATPIGRIATLVAGASAAIYAYAAGVDEATAAEERLRERDTRSNKGFKEIFDDLALQESLARSANDTTALEAVRAGYSSAYAAIAKRFQADIQENGEKAVANLRDLIESTRFRFGLEVAVGPIEAAIINAVEKAQVTKLEPIASDVRGRSATVRVIDQQATEALKREINTDLGIFRDIIANVRNRAAALGQENADLPGTIAKFATASEFKELARLINAYAGDVKVLKSALVRAAQVAGTFEGLPAGKATVLARPTLTAEQIEEQKVTLRTKQARERIDKLAGEIEQKFAVGAGNLGGFEGRLSRIAIQQSEQFKQTIGEAFDEVLSLASALIASVRDKRNEALGDELSSEFRAVTEDVNILTQSLGKTEESLAKATDRSEIYRNAVAQVGTVSEENANKINELVEALSRQRKALARLDISRSAKDAEFELEVARQSFLKPDKDKQLIRRRAELLNQLQESGLEFDPTALAAMARELQAFSEALDLQKLETYLSQFSDSLGDGISNALTKAISGEINSFEEFGRLVLENIVNSLQQSTAQILSESLSTLFKSLLASLFSGGGGGGTTLAAGNAYAGSSSPFGQSGTLLGAGLRTSPGTARAVSGSRLGLDDRTPGGSGSRVVNLYVNDVDTARRTARQVADDDRRRLNKK